MENKTITITVNVDGNAVSRNYKYDDKDTEAWGLHVIDMLNTIEKSEVKEF